MFRNIVKRAFQQTSNVNSFFVRRSFHHFRSNQEEQVFLKDWNRTTEMNRRYIAINQDPPMCAGIAIYQGHSYKANGDYDTAIARYSLAIHMDKSYKARAKEGIDDCKRLLEKEKNNESNERTESVLRTSSSPRP